MTTIDVIASVSTFEDYARNGLISLRPHKLDPELVIANYTPMMAFGKQWDDVTLNSRGLIFNKRTGEIVARPFRKFFNYGQSEAKHISLDGKIEVANKEDGSMGILYMAPDGRYAVSTRGSMHSEQAEHATEVFRNTYEGRWTPDEDYSFIFEIIYPEGRIVLDYGDVDDLILLGAIHKTTGASADRNTLDSFGWLGDTAEMFPFESMADVFSAPQRSDREGFVIHLVESDERLKVKFEEYLRIHKIMFNLSKRAVWEALSNGLNIDEWLSELPDEFTGEAKSWRDELVTEFHNVKNSAIKLHSELDALFGSQDKKSFALYMNEHKISGNIRSVVFLLANRSNEDSRINDTIWRSLRV